MLCFRLFCVFCIKCGALFYYVLLDLAMVHAAGQTFNGKSPLLFVLHDLGGTGLIPSSVPLL
jgi:hypothetical protein